MNSFFFSAHKKKYENVSCQAQDTKLSPSLFLGSPGSARILHQMLRDRFMNLYVYNLNLNRRRHRRAAFSLARGLTTSKTTTRVNCQLSTVNCQLSTVNC